MNYFETTTAREDAPVLAALRALPADRTYAYLEVGAGIGRFPLLLKNDPVGKKLDIACIDINPDLTGGLAKKGLKAVQGSVLAMPFKDDEFDVIHCSHVVEHFGYPDIVKVLDELFRVVKPGGLVIIRSPLMHPGFYNDVDHVRPYPPKTIMQYFHNRQQQKTSFATVELRSEWIRREAVHVGSRFIPGRVAAFMNALYKKTWTAWSFPKSRPNGYVAIFTKL